MEQCLKFLVPGEPQGKARPRFARRGRYVSTYTPKETQSYEALVRYYAANARAQKGLKPISAEMGLGINAYFKIPKSYSKKRKDRCLKGVKRPSKKPDSDNIAKIVLDGLNPKMKLNHTLHRAENVQEGLYLDDKQVVLVLTSKNGTQKSLE